MRISRLISYPLRIGLFILLLVWLVILIIFLSCIFLSCSNFRDILGNDIGVAVLTGIGAGTWFIFVKALEEYQNARNSALALTSDIASIMRVIEEAGIAQQFMLQFASPNKPFLWENIDRKENYFNVFEAQVGNLGMLREPKMVANVTRFYTFLKASRDVTSPLFGAIKGDSQSLTSSQTEETAQKKPGDPEKDHQIRMISVSVCKILDTTLNAGKKVIKTYKDIYGERGYVNENPIVEKTLKDICRFLSFWKENCVKYREEGSSALDEEIKKSPFFIELRERYSDIKGLRNRL